MVLLCIYNFKIYWNFFFICWFTHGPALIVNITHKSLAIVLSMFQILLPFQRLMWFWTFDLLNIWKIVLKEQFLLAIQELMLCGIHNITKIYNSSIITFSCKYFLLWRIFQCNLMFHISFIFNLLIPHYLYFICKLKVSVLLVCHHIPFGTANFCYVWFSGCNVYPDIKK